MANLEDNIWTNLPAELAEFLEDITQLWNGGRIPINIFSAPPTSSTPAEGSVMGLAKDGATWKLYFYTDATDKWQSVSLSAVA